MKPLTAARLTAACGRIRKRLSSAPANLERLLETLATAQARPYLRWINVSRGTDVRLITVGEICYFRSDTKYTRAVTAEAESLIRKSLKELLDAPRSGALLADPPFHGGQRECDRQLVTRLPRPPDRETEGAPGDIASKPALCAPVSGNVTPQAPIPVAPRTSVPGRTRS